MIRLKQYAGAEDQDWAREYAGKVEAFLREVAPIVGFCGDNVTVSASLPSGVPSFLPRFIDIEGPTDPAEKRELMLILATLDSAFIHYEVSPSALDMGVKEYVDRFQDAHRLKGALARVERLAEERGVTRYEDVIELD